MPPVVTHMPCPECGVDLDVYWHGKPERLGSVTAAGRIRRRVILRVGHIHGCPHAKDLLKRLSSLAK